jgi:protein XagA
VVVTATASQATKTFDANGDLQPTARYNKQELQALLEYGITDRVTAMFAPGLQRVEISSPTYAHRTGLGFTEFGGRFRLLQGETADFSWVLSAQGTLRVPGTYDTANPAAIGYTGMEADIRGLLGASFIVGGWPTFVDLQLAQRFRTEGPPSEWRVDLTAGTRFAEKWGLLAQSFNVFSEGSGSPPFTSTNYHKLQMSLIYYLTDQWALQGGLFTTFAGRNALQENGVMVGTGYKF